MVRSIDIPVSVDGLLAEFASAGAIGWSGVHLARTLSHLSGESRPEVLLAIALCLRVQEAGSVCLPLDDVVQHGFGVEPDDEAPQPTASDGPSVELGDLAWPEVDLWLEMLASSPLVARGQDAAANQRPLRLVGRQVYLERNWQAEEQVRKDLWARLDTTVPAFDEAALTPAIDQVFQRFSAGPDARQRDAVRTAASSWTSVIAGGPGTGKTTTIAQLLRVLDELADRHTTVALASFTGKAASRMQQSLDASLAGFGQSGRPWRHLQVAPASTLHSLLGARPNAGFGRCADHPLSQDLLIIDEMSMVSLDLMAGLLAALRPTTRLVMVGDPHQLSSVDAGAVLADIVAAGLPISRSCPASAITVLDHSHRFSGPILDLADAIKQGNSQRALDLLASDDTRLEWVALDPDPGGLAGLAGLSEDLLGQARAMHGAALSGRAPEALTALDRHRLLCAHRRGRYGVADWSRAVERHLRSRIGGYGREGGWYLGRPVLITRNAPELQVSNGDTGVAVLVGDSTEVALAGGDRPRFRSPWLLDAIETMHALTVHKSQGSEYDDVSLILPDVDSPLLTRELLYTAVTRARRRVRIIATAAAITKAIRTPARRATGLGTRLRVG